MSRWTGFWLFVAGALAVVIVPTQADETCFAGFEEIEQALDQALDGVIQDRIVTALPLDDAPFIDMPAGKAFDDSYIKACIDRALAKIRKRPAPPLKTGGATYYTMLSVNDGLQIQTQGLGVGRPADGELESWVELLLNGVVMGNTLLVPISKTRSGDLLGALQPINDAPAISTGQTIDTMNEAADMAGAAQRGRQHEPGSLVRLKLPNAIAGMLVDDTGNAVFSVECRVSQREPYPLSIYIQPVNDAPESVYTFANGESEELFDLAIVTCPEGFEVSE